MTRLPRALVAAAGAVILAILETFEEILAPHHSGHYPWEPQTPVEPAPTYQTGDETPDPVQSDTPPILSPQTPTPTGDKP